MWCNILYEYTSACVIFDCLSLLWFTTDDEQEFEIKNR